MLARLCQKGADHADAAQTLAQDGVLAVNVLVGIDPQRHDLAPDEDHGQQDERDEGKHHEREHDVLAQRQQDAAEEQDRDRRDRAGEHGGDP